MTSEQVWQFHVVEGPQFDNNGATYFNERATEMAETMGCRVVNTNNIELQNTPGGIWMVTGTVGLERAKTNA